MKTIASQKIKVLAVDDNPKNIQVIGSILRDEGYSVGFAYDGQQALDLLSEIQDFDLVLLDVNMPVMDGFETCKAMRKNENMKKIPVVFLTALNDSKDVVDGFEAGGQDYITKPFNSKEVLARVETHLELKHSKDKLMSVNQMLEEKVNERTAQLLHANQELEKVNQSLLELDKAKGDFLQLISHEIRTPLNGILGFINLLKETVDSGELLMFIEALEESANRLQEFSLNAIILTSLKLGRYKLNVDNVFVSPLVNSLIDSFSKEIKSKRINFQCNISSDVIFRMDQELMTLCLKNIIDNVIKYSYEGGLVQINVSSEDNECIIEIIDEGKGFSERALSNLFKLFSPGEKHVDKNIGVGLALSNLIVKAHSGEISVKNRIPKGAFIRIMIPIINMQ